jgi:hypothetical protein
VTRFLAKEKGLVVLSWLGSDDFLSVQVSMTMELERKKCTMIKMHGNFKFKCYLRTLRIPIPCARNLIAFQRSEKPLSGNLTLDINNLPTLLDHLIAFQRSEKPLSGNLTLDINNLPTLLDQ